MEENQPIEKSGQPDPVISPDDTGEMESRAGHACANCQRPALEEDHPTPLCSECREHFTRLSIPLWIKLFAAGIAAVLVFSLFDLPRSIALGIHLKRGEKAMEQHRYNTAEIELKQVVAKTPDNIEAVGHLLIAAFYNQDSETMDKEVKKLHNVRIDDDELLSGINSAIDKENQYFTNDSFENFKNTHPGPVADTSWSGYFAHNPDDRYALMEYATAIFEKKDYNRCDSLLRIVLKSDDEYVPALLMAARIKRELGDLDRALRYSQKIVEINRESTLGLAAGARILLAQKKDAPALGMALQAYKINPLDAYSMSTLILAYHFNGQTARRDALIREANAAVSDSSEKTYLQFASDVVNKKEVFR